MTRKEKIKLHWLKNSWQNATDVNVENCVKKNNYFGTNVSAINFLLPQLLNMVSLKCPSNDSYQDNV